MKKLYTMLFAAGFGVAASAQSYDLQLTTDNYTTLEATSDDPLELDFTVENVGSTTIPTGDSIFFAVSDLTNVWSTNTLAAGYVTYVILTAPLAPTEGFLIDVATIDMAWVYDNIGLTGNVCVEILGVNYFAGTPPTMLTPLNDANCVQYTVTEVAGLEGVGMDYISVYPNPATEVVNFQVGNNEVSHINVFDMNGRLVSAMQVTGNIETLDTENIQNGIYYYQMMNGEVMVATEKFVVSK
jgi:hypothetical protein